MSPSLPILSIHQYNPASGKGHQRLLRLLGELNRVIEQSGLAKTEYLAWKVIDEQQGPFSFVFGSLWPDRKTYEEVHRLEAFEDLVARCKAGDQLFEIEVQNRFELLNSEPGSIPVVLSRLVSRLAMEAAVVESREAEERLIKILEQGSAAIARAGHPETRYDLWRITGQAQGPFTHLFGSLWASPKAYEEVHAHPAHQAFMKEYGGTLEKLLTRSMSNRYDRLDLG